MENKGSFVKLSPSISLSNPFVYLIQGERFTTEKGIADFKSEDEEFTEEVLNEVYEYLANYHFKNREKESEV